jgi:hypothetical protein
MITKAEFDGKHCLIQSQVDDLRLSKATLEGKADQKSVNMILLISIIGIILSVISLFKEFLIK